MQCLASFPPTARTLTKTTVMDPVSSRASNSQQQVDDFFALQHPKNSRAGEPYFHPSMDDVPPPVSVSGILSFIDITGFTALSKRLSRHPDGAERLAGIVNRLLTWLIDHCLPLGDVWKFSGDAIMVLYDAASFAGSLETGEATQGFLRLLHIPHSTGSFLPPVRRRACLLISSPDSSAFPSAPRPFSFSFSLSPTPLL